MPAASMPPLLTQDTRAQADYLRSPLAYVPWSALANRPASRQPALLARTRAERGSCWRAHLRAALGRHLPRGPNTLLGRPSGGCWSGRIHNRLFRHLGLPGRPPHPSIPLRWWNLGDGEPPIRPWRESWRWQQERQPNTFPAVTRSGTSATLHPGQLGIAGRDPGAAPATSGTGPLIGRCRNLAAALLVGAEGQICAAERLRGTPAAARFLDLQLRSTPQEPADRTRCLYGGPRLALPRSPGSWHLEGLDAGPGRASAP